MGLNEKWRRDFGNKAFREIWWPEVYGRLEPEQQRLFDRPEPSKPPTVAPTKQQTQPVVTPQPVTKNLHQADLKMMADAVMRAFQVAPQSFVSEKQRSIHPGNIHLYHIHQIEVSVNELGQGKEDWLFESDGVANGRAYKVLQYHTKMIVHFRNPADPIFGTGAVLYKVQVIKNNTDNVVMVLIDKNPPIFIE